MTNLKNAIIYMILLLTFVYNVERLDFGGENIVDIQSFLYVLIAITVLTNIIGRKIHVFPPVYHVAFWSAVYFVLKLTVFNEHQLFGNFYTYLTITEITLLVVTVLLSYHLANTLLDYESVIEKITFPKNGRLIDKAVAQDVVNTEFVRSRRHNRPLSLIVVEMSEHANQFILERTVKSIQQAMFNRFLFTSLAKVLTEEARRSDVVIEQSENQFILLCPETTTPGSVRLAERIQELVIEKLGIMVKCGFASFPEEALTFEDLRQRAYSNLLTPEELTDKINSGAFRDEAVILGDTLNTIKTDHQS